MCFRVWPSTLRVLQFAEGPARHGDCFAFPGGHCNARLPPPWHWVVRWRLARIYDLVVSWVLSNPSEAGGQPASQVPRVSECQSAVRRRLAASAAAADKQDESPSPSKRHGQLTGLLLRRRAHPSLLPFHAARLSAASATEMLAPSIARWPRPMGVVFCDATLPTRRFAATPLQMPSMARPLLSLVVG